MATDYKPAPPPIDSKPKLVLLIGTILWFIAFVVLLALVGKLADNGHLNWLWTSLAGWVLGLGGLITVSHQKTAHS